ncbi:AraC family transcriptional regulator [Rhodococcus rhodnii]|uniref:AraC family transcriptional regulator n=2 Tax=Rhodococcus rhodnii TaxID=38312 RepID=R7WQ59_9NOCA|nr:AraC family transcriptional regulator [Rhodococcus rhodnii]EOM77395.1 AraC family transcriptional regulator [Rhodococcus rhodnii LMG 5362]TXG90645.1 AraC family transcriptional regulator [Rhodococcus rhodnii]
MDTLSEVLDNIRSSGALIARSLIEPPWAIRVEGGSSITLATMIRGDGWIHQDGCDPVALHNRDLTLLTGPGPVVLSSRPSGRIEPVCVVTADGTCADAVGNPLDDAAVGLGDRDVQARLGAEHVVLTGSFPTSGRIAQRLLGALPPVIVVPRGRQRSRALDLLETELDSQEPGRQAVVDRVLDLVLIGALRDWFALPDVTGPAWYRAADDPVVGPALSALHSDPAQKWTVDSLAREARVSRATFARRFAEVMGEPPISYLAGWRLCLAADLLQDGADTIESIARQVGYSSAYALSTAFIREYGVRPSRHRALARSRSA